VQQAVSVLVARLALLVLLAVSARLVQQQLVLALAARLAQQVLLAHSLLPVLRLLVHQQRLVALELELPGLQVLSLRSMERLVLLELSLRSLEQPGLQVQ
jgi:hypothetical protein